jgi:hypothetical protein
MGRKILLGFAGPGKVSDANIKDNLGDYLGFGKEDSEGLPTFGDDVDEILVIIPASDALLTKTVERLWEWTDAYADLPYEVIYSGDADDIDIILKRSEQAVKARNVVAAMVDRLVEGTKDGYEVSLIVAVGEDGLDRDTEMLVDLAQAKGLMVKGLDQGMDDLQFDGEPEPEPEPNPTRRSRRTAKDPEAVDETPTDEDKPRPRRGAPRKQAETSPEPAEDTQMESVEDEVSHARRKAEKPAEDAPDDEVLSALKASRWLSQSLDACHAAMTGRTEPVPSELSRQIDRAIDKYTGAKPANAEEAEPEEKPRRTAGRPRSDGSPARKRTPAQRGVKEWFDEAQGEDGEWVRAGRGRLPRDVKTRTVDPKTGVVITED